MPNESADEIFLLKVQGFKHYAPFIAGWQEFKDDLRTIIKHQPGRTDVTIGSPDGDAQGWCNIHHTDDASIAYDHYASKRGVIVHLFKLSRPATDCQLLRCNCNPQLLDMGQGGYPSYQLETDFTGAHAFIPQMSGVLAPPQYEIPPPPTSWYGMYPQTVVYSPPPLYSYYMAPLQMVPQQPSVYSAASNGLPVDVSNGKHTTDARAISVNNLKGTATIIDILRLFDKAVHPIEINMHNDPKTNTFKGSATARFATSEQALAAARAVHRKEHMGMMINVHLDKERAMIARVPSPLIVNGSFPARPTTKGP